MALLLNRQAVGSWTLGSPTQEKFKGQGVCKNKTFYQVTFPPLRPFTLATLRKILISLINLER